MADPRAAVMTSLHTTTPGGDTAGVVERARSVATAISLAQKTTSDATPDKSSRGIAARHR